MDKERGNELEIDNEYIMSPKDLKTIHFLNKLLDAGVRVLKIEGRARPPEYVKTVVECYNEAIHAYVSDQFTREKIENWDQRLSTVFNRGFWDGYYLGQKLGEWSEVYGSQSTEKKIYLGKVTNYFNRIGVAEFLIETGSLQKGDRILITGPTTGVMNSVVNEMRIDEMPADSANKGNRFSSALPGPVRRSDKLYKIIDRKNTGT